MILTVIELDLEINHPKRPNLVEYVAIYMIFTNIFKFFYLPRFSDLVLFANKAGDHTNFSHAE